MKELSESAVITLSISRALWGEVSPALRAVQFEMSAGRLDLFCIFDGEISAEDRESMSVVATSVSADFPEIVVQEHCVQLDLPAKMSAPPGRYFVFVRKE